jgi:hypothetical protein
MCSNGKETSKMDVVFHEFAVCRGKVPLVKISLRFCLQITYVLCGSQIRCHGGFGRERRSGCFGQDDRVSYHILLGM